MPLLGFAWMESVEYPKVGRVSTESDGDRPPDVPIRVSRPGGREADAV
jgi:hypothetical protein